MMHICKVESNGRQYQIYNEDGYAFSLYRSEVKKYHIEEDRELEDALVDEIYQTILYKRAKERALFLLERRPYSIADLTMKLKRNRYPVTVIDQVIAFLKKYHYLDDASYAEMYVNSYASNKSRKQMTYDLLKKGIDIDIIRNCLEQQKDDELRCFQSKFERYISGKDLDDYVIRQKIYRYFYSKGFPSYMIENALNQYANMDK